LTLLLRCSLCAFAGWLQAQRNPVPADLGSKVATYRVFRANMPGQLSVFKNRSRHLCRYRYRLRLGIWNCVKPPWSDPWLAWRSNPVLLCPGLCFYLRIAKREGIVINWRISPLLTTDSGVQVYPVGG